MLVLAVDAGVAGMQQAVSTPQGDLLTILQDPGTGGGLPAAGDVIVDPNDASKNFITNLQRYTFIEPVPGIDDNRALFFVPDPPSSYRWVLADPQLVTPRIEFVSPFNAQVSDRLILINTVAGHPVTVNLPDHNAVAIPSGKQMTVKDGNGGAAADNITINANGSTIDGAAFQTISAAHGSFTMTWINAANGWQITAKV